jgi:hypothetical protein
MRRLLTLGALAILCAGPAAAAIPGLMSYQGLLADGNGTIVADGDYPLTFKLYGVAAGGAALWSESQEVTVTDGVFNAYLGTITPFVATLFTDSLWLGITVDGGGEMSPRIRLAASPYTFTAQHVEPNVVSSIDGVTSDEGNVDLVAGANVTIVANDAANTITISAPQSEVFSYGNESATTTILATPMQYNQAHATLTVPGPGYITVTSSVRFKINHYTGTTDTICLNHSTTPTTIGIALTMMTEEVRAAIPTTGQIEMTRTVVGNFPVLSAGTYTYYLVGQMLSGQDVGDVFWYAQTTGVYHAATPAAVQEMIDLQQQVEEKSEFTP